MRIFTGTVILIMLTSTWSLNLMANKARETNRLVIPRLQAPVDINAEWDKEPWRGMAAAELTNYMGDYPAHFPRVLFKAAYDDDAIYVIYQVHDRYVVAVTEDYQGSVYKDSCVEFFFTPGEDVSIGYFNLEMNCGGTALFQFQKEPRTNIVKIARTDFDRITVAHSMPKIVQPEIADSLTWTLEYRIPFSIIKKYAPTVIPQPGVKWRANFYKCADESSHPHWLTWAPVEYARPNFHLPEYFGVLEFGAASAAVVEKEARQLSFSMHSYPEPFNSRTTIKYSVPRPVHLKLDIYDINGALVKHVFDKFHESGEHQVVVDGSELSSGVYVCVLSGGESSASLKIRLVK